ncbi:imelysin family protein [uncultured Flavobacterium sp.]|uniref:imelysin family protein n=1 Tax=uncultured Flavobacterium sp. TaxID=165435 RepID=UPI0030CA1E4F
MKKIFLFIGISLIVFACSSSDNSDDSLTDAYDRTAMLNQWADNIIIPSFANYDSKLQTLSTDVSNFTSNPTQANLLVARTSWINAYNAYQKVAMFNVGKALEINVKEASNTYPTDVVALENNIATGVYDLGLISQYSKQGFPALDYLLNGLGSSDANILVFYTSNSNANNYKQYLIDVTAKLKTNSNSVLTDWTTSYRATFISSNGNAVSSSVNKMTNLFVKNLEKDIRSGKIGIPSGIFSSGVLYPEKVEAYYKNDISKELLNTAVQAQQDFFNGKNFSNSSTGPSLKSYLDYVNTVRSGQNLSDIINNQFLNIYTSNNLLDNNFSTQITNDNSKMLNAYDALQLNVVYIKLDMMQALNITIDYVDGDGD